MASCAATKFVTIMACDIVGFSKLKSHQARAAKEKVTAFLRSSSPVETTRAGWADAGDGGYLLLEGGPDAAYRAVRAFIAANDADAGDPQLSFRYALHEGRATPLQGYAGTEYQSPAINETERRLSAMSKEHVGQIVISGAYRATLEDEVPPDGRECLRLRDVADKHGTRHEVWNLVTPEGHGVTPAPEELWRDEQEAPKPSSLHNLPRLPTEHFVDLPDAIAQLDAAILDGNAALTQAIQGLGGVGKTTLAIHYARRAEVAARFPVRWWVRAETEQETRRRRWSWRPRSIWRTSRRQRRTRSTRR